MYAREPRISTKEPCTGAKEACTSAQKPWNSSICAWYDAMQCWLTLSCGFCLLLMCAKEPRIFTQQPCTAAKELCISAQKPWNSGICAWYDAMQCWLTLSSDYCLFVCAKEPRISTKEPCTGAKDLCISAFPQKKSPGIAI